jgi:antitoxin (DNA-binding transcriptional repressor) of toxin-antitoxin stability system
MKKTNVANLRSNLSALLDYVQKGKEVQIEKRNILVARLVPVPQIKENRTKLGVGAGTVEILGNIVDSSMADDWEMLQ